MDLLKDLLKDPRFDSINILNLQEMPAYIGTSCDNRNVTKYNVYTVARVIEYSAAGSPCKEDNLSKMQEAIRIRKWTP